jgi:hypothetical protein
MEIYPSQQASEQTEEVTIPGPSNTMPTRHSGRVKPPRPRYLYWITAMMKAILKTTVKSIFAATVLLLIMMNWVSLVLRLRLEDYSLGLAISITIVLVGIGGCIVGFFRHTKYLAHTVRVWGWLGGLIVLAVILVPNASERPQARSRISRVVGSAESVRAALAAYAADSDGNSFPTGIDNWDALRVIANANGADLPPTERKAGFSFRGYTASDMDADGIVEDYTMSFRLLDIPESDGGWLVVIGPSGIEKKSLRPSP